jgi:hypothetical protein
MRATNAVSKKERSERKREEPVFVFVFVFVCQFCLKERAQTRNIFISLLDFGTHTRLDSLTWPSLTWLGLTWPDLTWPRAMAPVNNSFPSSSSLTRKRRRRNRRRRTRTRRCQSQMMEFPNMFPNVLRTHAISSPITCPGKTNFDQWELGLLVVGVRSFFSCKMKLGTKLLVSSFS